MRIRAGFVSNSSSSSFVLGKCYMTEEQGRDFIEFIENHRLCYSDWNSEDFSQGNKFFEETYIDYNNDYYFHGTVDYRDAECVTKFLEKIGVKKDYIVFGD